MPMPLEGIRVIDWTIWQQGPVSTAILGDLGADVIKLEQAGVGDPGRGLMSAFGQSNQGDAPDFYVETNNRNKKGITLDLKNEAGCQVLRDLIAKSDVLATNMRASAVERLGFDFETVHELNSKLIYATASGFGPKGPEAGRPSFDYLGLARSGMMHSAGEPDDDPAGISAGIADQMGGVMLASGIVTALLARERFGIGQKVDTSQLGSMSFLQGLSLGASLLAGTSLPRVARKKAGNPLWNHYRCRDGRWIAFAMLQPDRYWADFCRALEHEELIEDPRYVDLKVRAANAESVIELFDQVFLERDRSEWLERMDKAGDIIFCPVNTVDDLANDDEQMLANGYIQELDHPEFGPTKMVGVPWTFSETPGSVRMPAPQLGQHTEEILMDVLGYDWDRISKLREDGAI